MILLKQNFQRQQKKLKHFSARMFNASSLILSPKTPFDSVARNELCKIRYYASPDKIYKEPLVFIVCLAINMDIYDLYLYRSLVKHFQHSCFDVYLDEWKRFNFIHRHLNIL